MCCNHLIYADDTVLLAPSPKALQILIGLCVAFGIENDIVYNKEKTKCMCIKPSVRKDLYVPAFHLGHLTIKIVEKETYFGYIINARGNVLMFSTVQRMLRLPFLRHIVQLYTVAHCRLNFVQIQLVKYMLPLTKYLKPL